MTRIAAIIVTYNRKDKLLQCIDAVRRQTSEVRPDIIVVDNNSSDGTGEAVKDYILSENSKSSYCDTVTANSGKMNFQVKEGVTTTGNRIIYNNLRYNSGGAGGFCYGMRKAVEAGYDYLWLMDDDCIPDARALEEYLKFAAVHDNDWGYLSGKTLWKDGRICEMNVQRETWSRDLRDFEHDEKRIEMASFVSLFLPARVVRDVGLPFRKFFLWTDDWEYTRRISRKYPCWYVPGSIAMHMCDDNTGADISAATDERVERFRYLYRNDVYLYRREGIRGAAYEVARLMVHTARISKSRYNMREKLHRIGIMVGGTADGLLFFPEPERAYIED